MLTDEELRDICLEYRGDNERGRAIESAVLAKLREQEPVAWQFVDDEEAGYIAYQSKPPTQEAIDYLAKWDRPAWQPLYLHPAPIPEGWQPIETAPIDENVILTDGESVEEGVFFSGSWRWNRNENIAFATHWTPLPKPPMAAVRSGE